jgi:pectate lyase
MEKRLFYRLAGIFLSALCLLAFACKSPANNTTPGEKPPVLVEEITINSGDLTLKTGATASLTVTISPADADNKTVTWNSSRKSVATIDENSGQLTATGIGEAIITAMAKDGSGVCSVGINVTVTNAPILVETITINGGNNVILQAGQTKKLALSVLPAAAGNKNVTWASSDSQKVEVLNQSGDIKAHAEGTAVISAAAQDDSGVKGAITVTVTKADDPAAMTPQEIFDSLKGQKITTNGWADRANSGAGLSYANPANFILIDDASYPVAETKYKAFINANVTNASINSDTGVISGGTVSNDQKFIIISGDIDLSNGRINDGNKSFYDQFDPSTNNRINGDIILNIGSNTTIIGINNARIMFGGIRINNRSNVIIRNVTFYDAHGSTEKNTASSGNSESKASIDALVVQGTSEGVWVDHCKFTDGTCKDLSRNFNHDGAFDIPRGKYVTVSWCEFTNHDKVMLVAGSDSAENAVAEQRQITLHHIYFHGTTQRMPRTRGTQMHIYNNYYENIGNPENSGSFMGPGWGAEFIVENNYFSSKPSGGKTIEWFDTNATYPVKFYYSGNNIADSNTSWWGRASNPKPWEPAYQYMPDANADLPTSVPAEAGPTLAFKKIVP